MRPAVGVIMDEVVRRLRSAGCVYAEEEAELLIAAADDDHDRLAELVAGRVAGEPLEQLLGWVAFAGLRLAVGPDVFVPRVRTELLAERAASMITDCMITDSMITDDSTVVELCCGVAPVSAVIQRSAPQAWLFAVDIDPAVMTYARRNLSQRATVLLGDLYDPLPGSIIGRVDVIAANAPYVPTEAIALMPREARDHEPLVALDGGRDGADVHRKIIYEAPTWLRSGGTLLIETGREQSMITAGEMRDRGFTVEIVIDYERDATVVVGTLAGLPRSLE